MLFDPIFPKGIELSGYVFPSGRESFNEGYLTNKGKRRILLELILFLFCFVNLFISFLMTYFTNPGDVPSESFWKLRIPKNLNSQMKLECFALTLVAREELLETNNNYIYFTQQGTIDGLSSAPCSLSSVCYINDGSFYHVSERSDTNEVRYCKTCLLFKPDRTHHCKVCNKCILKMDHHCPYIGCCIGYFNYKYFNLLLLYSWVITLMFLIIYGVIAQKVVLNSMNGKFHFNEIMFFIGYLFTIFLLIFSFSLWSFHIYLDTSNISTFEYVEMNKRRLNTQKISLLTVNFDYTSRYSIGKFYNNLKQVYGEYFILWLLPIPPIHKDKQWNNGINFKLNERYAYEIIKAV